MYQIPKRLRNKEQEQKEQRKRNKNTLSAFVVIVLVLSILDNYLYFCETFPSKIFVTLAI